MSETWGMLEWERRRLADDLEALPAEAWAAPTQCGDWTVRDVVGHVSGLPSPAQAILGVLRSFGNVDRFVDSVAHERAKKSPEDLVADLRSFATSRQVPPGVPVSGSLLEAIVHGEDIRAATGGTIDDRPPAHLVTALGFAVRSGSVFRGKRRAAGLTLVADDIDWRAGDGPEARGSGLDVLCALLGRGQAAQRLDGPGAATLVERAG